MPEPAVISPLSRTSLAAIRRTTVRSSDVAGWTSLLIEQHVVHSHGEVMSIPPTPDQTIVVGLRGGQALEVHTGRGIRVEEYRSGSVGLASPGTGQLLARRPVTRTHRFEKINLYVPARTLAEAAEELRLPRRSSPRLPQRSSPWHDPTLRATAVTLLTAAQRGAPDLYAATAMHWLCVHLLTLHGDLARPAISRVSGPTERGIAAAVELIRTNFAHALSLDELAKTAHLSKFHFARVFRRSTGYPPHVYLTRTRLAAAAALLQGTELTVREIALRSGFNRPQSLERAFLSAVGSTPIDFRLSREPIPALLTRGRGVASARYVPNS